MITSPFAKTSLWLVWLLLLAGCSSLSQKKVTGYDHVSVYFATTREYDASATPDRAFTKTGTKKEWIFYVLRRWAFLYLTQKERKRESK